jgi:hypothetical protein
MLSVAIKAASGLLYVSWGSTTPARKILEERDADVVRAASAAAPSALDVHGSAAAHTRPT